MLYWNEKQSRAVFRSLICVVIWCFIEMRNNHKADAHDRQLLWFDALLKWETIYFATPTIKGGCDLMLYWNEKQYQQAVAECRHVVIWCFIEMRNNFIMPEIAATYVVIWCFIEMRNNLAQRHDAPRLLWFDALLKWETMLAMSKRTVVMLWFDALLKWETIPRLPYRRH